MKTFEIHYDEHSGQDYNPLYQAIKKLGDHIHPFRCTWFVRSDSTASQIHDYLWQHMYKNDRLMVLELISARAAWQGLTQAETDWLKRCL